MKNKIDVYIIKDTFKREAEMIAFLHDNLSEEKVEYTEQYVDESGIIEILTHPKSDNCERLSIVIGTLPETLFLVKSKIDDIAFAEEFSDFIKSTLNLINIYDFKDKKSDKCRTRCWNEYIYNKIFWGENLVPKRYIINYNRFGEIYCIESSLPFTQITFNEVSGEKQRMANGTISCILKICYLEILRMLELEFIRMGRFRMIMKEDIFIHIIIRILMYVSFLIRTMMMHQKFQPLY